MLISGCAIMLTRQCSGAVAEAGITTALITDRSREVRLRRSVHRMMGLAVGAGGIQSRNCTPPPPCPQSVAAQKMIIARRRIDRSSIQCLILSHEGGDCYGFSA